MKSNYNCQSSKRGSALVFALIAVAVLALLGAAALTLSASTNRAINHSKEDLRSFYLAEAGISEGIAAVVVADENGDPLPNNVGTEASPRTLNGGNYWVAIVENPADETIRITSIATMNSGRRGLEAVLERTGQSIYNHALFAGNSSNDPTYSLTLGGSGSQADRVRGDVYSGGDVNVNGTADVDGTIRATGSVSGDDGTSGITQPIPDLPGMDYAGMADVDVAAEFASGANFAADPLGGSAWELPEDNPAHIFRKNPDDRTSDTSPTTKEDYFLEDPHEAVRIDAGMDGSDACEITLTGVNGRPGVNGSNKVYYIDGNLWLHNRRSYSFKFTHDTDEDAVVTFVVNGNIYFSDNLFYQDMDHDAVAFIALKDPAVPDSGNIYFGDPVFGTLEQMHAFMYAENNFYDVNLDASGSANVRVFGNMTAGNHVSINRDFDTGSGIEHSQLVVDFDSRIVNRLVEPPGLPHTPGSTAGLQIVSWREISAF